jgi:hypothetical protein
MVANGGEEQGEVPMRGWSNFPRLTYFYGTAIIQNPGPDPRPPSKIWSEILLMTSPWFQQLKTIGSMKEVAKKCPTNAMLHVWAGPDLGCDKCLG